MSLIPKGGYQPPTAAGRARYGAELRALIREEHITRWKNVESWAKWISGRVTFFRSGPTTCMGPEGSWEATCGALQPRKAKGLTERLPPMSVVVALRAAAKRLNELADALIAAGLRDEVPALRRTARRK